MGGHQRSGAILSGCRICPCTGAQPMVEPGPLTFEEFGALRAGILARRCATPTSIRPTGASRPTLRGDDHCQWVGHRGGPPGHGTHPGSIIPLPAAHGQGTVRPPSLRTARSCRSSTVRPGQVDDGDIYEVVMPQVATEMPPPWPELKFDDEGKIVYGQQSEAGLWPEKEKDPTFDLEAWLAERPSGNARSASGTRRRNAGQQAAGSTGDRSVDYFLGCTAGRIPGAGPDWRRSDLQASSGRYRPIPAPCRLVGSVQSGPQGRDGGAGSAQSAWRLRGIDTAANEAALVEAVNNLVGGAAGVAQNIGSSSGGWQGFINRLFQLCGRWWLAWWWWRSSCLRRGCGHCSPRVGRRPQPRHAARRERSPSRPT